VKSLSKGRIGPIKLRPVLCLAIFGAILMGALSCTHGPPELMVRIENARFQPESNLIAVAIEYEKRRRPTGIINTFPNGGVSKVLVSEARVYLCDTDTLTVQKLVSIEQSDQLKYGFTPWILGWKEDAIVLLLTGKAGTSRADYDAGSNEEIYLVDLQGNVTTLTERPKTLTSTWQTNKDAPSLFAVGDRVEVGPLGNVLFRIDANSGELVATGE
jgi:hypothetical protein